MGDSRGLQPSSPQRESHLGFRGNRQPPGVRHRRTERRCPDTFIIDKLEGALESLGARLEDVVRTRVFVRDVASWENVARVHGERFGHIQPANTLVEAALVSEEALVEIEADAEV